MHKFILYNQKWRKLPLRISSETFFSRQRKFSAMVHMVMHFPQRHQSRFPFLSFLASFVCIADNWLLCLYSHCHLVKSRMVLVCQNQKNYQVSHKNSKKPPCWQAGIVETYWKIILIITKLRSFIKRQANGTLGDNEWQGVTTSDTTNDSKWYTEWQQVTANDNEWYNEWQRITTNGNEWQRVRAVVQRMKTAQYTSKNRFSMTKRDTLILQGMDGCN